MHQLKLATWVILTIFTGLSLNCSLLTRLRSINQADSDDTSATKVAAINEDTRLVAEAQTKIESLPGHRIETQYVVLEAGQAITYTWQESQDDSGNRHLIIESSTGEHEEFYLVGGHAYSFDTQYSGWADLGTATVADLQQHSNVLPPDFNLAQKPVQLLTRFGAVPTRAEEEALAGRATRRYALQPLLAEISEAFEQKPVQLPLTLSGSLWVDQETGALVQSHIVLRDSETGQSLQTYDLTISEIGQVEPVAEPAPIIDPLASASATATAQVWTILEGQMNFRGTPLKFELIPLEVSQVANSSPRSAEVDVIVRQLPEPLFQSGDFEPFLAQLRHQLTLSIPNRNLVVTSSGFRLEGSDALERVLRVVYTFNADLEDFSGVEIILAGQGNPSFAPIPVK